MWRARPARRPKCTRSSLVKLTKTPWSRTMPVAVQRDRVPTGPRRSAFARTDSADTGRLTGCSKHATLQSPTCPPQDNYAPHNKPETSPQDLTDQRGQAALETRDTAKIGLHGYKRADLATTLRFDRPARFDRLGNARSRQYRPSRPRQGRSRLGARCYQTSKLARPGNARPRQSLNAASSRAAPSPPQQPAPRPRAAAPAPSGPSSRATTAPRSLGCARLAADPP